jgi:acylphosphatase
MPCAKFIVSGKVQGVFFRASTRERAVQLKIDGYAKNLPNGNVEVLAQGSASALNALHAWLKVGPSAAKIDDVLRFDTDEHVPAGFVTR